MSFQDTKVYYDGSHYIAIPYRPPPGRRGIRMLEEEVTVIEASATEQRDETGMLSEIGGILEPLTDDCEDETTEAEVTEDIPAKAPTKPSVPRKATRRELFNELYQKIINEPKRSRRQKLIDGMRPYFKSEQATVEFVDINIERKQRNLISRRMRLSRKVNLHEFNYFCTFTYDGKLHTEQTFRKKLGICLSRFCSRKGWKYAGVWECAPKTERLHFHGIFYIPEGTMPGILYEKEDYNFNTHRRQTTVQNSYFNEHFGRCDFEPIDDKARIGDAMAYIMKYIEKSGEKIVYSKGLPMYFISDILDDDVVCRIGMEDQKLLLFDNFSCWDEGVYIGEVSPAVIKQLRKSN